MIPLRRMAWVAGVIPLVVGTAIFVGWLYTREKALGGAGLTLIFVSCASVAAGLICWAIYLWLNWANDAARRRRLAWHTVALLVLYASNFVAAGAYVLKAAQIDSRYDLSITNCGDSTLQDVHVDGGGVSVDFGDIPDGQTVSRSFWIQQDGHLILTATRGGADIEVIVDGYVTNGMGNQSRVTVPASGSVTVNHSRSGPHVAPSPSDD